MNRKLEMEAVEDEENELLNKLSGIEQYFENKTEGECHLFKEKQCINEQNKLIMENELTDCVHKVSDQSSESETAKRILENLSDENDIAVKKVCVRELPQEINAASRWHKSVDHVLPVEIMMEIFKYLPINDRKAARLVCKRWYDINNAKTFMMTQTFVCCGIYETRSIITTLMKTQCKFLNLKFYHVNFEDYPIQFWQTCGPKIHALDFVDCLLSEETLINMITYCEELEHLCLILTRKLCSNDVLIDLLKANKQRPKLISFELHLNRSEWFSNSILQNLFALFPKISRITYTCNSLFPILCGNKVEDGYSPHVTEFKDLWSPQKLTFSSILNKILTPPDCIEKLNLYLHISTQQRGFAWKSIINYANLHRLREISIEIDFRNIESTDVIKFCAQQKQLKTLNCIIMGSTNFGVCLFLTQILENCIALRNIDVIQSEDFVFINYELFKKLLCSGLRSLRFECNAIFLDSNFTEEIELPLNSTLHTLKLHTSFAVSDSIRLPLIKKFRNLKNLELHEVSDNLMQAVWEYQTNLIYLKLSSFETFATTGTVENSNTAYSIQRLKKLVYLVIEAVNPKWEEAPGVFPEFVLPDLRYLRVDIDGNLQLQLQLLKRIQTFSKLVGVSVRCPGVSQSHAIWWNLASKWKHLRYLKIVDPKSQKLKIKHYLYFFKQCPELRALVHKFHRGSESYYYDVLEKKVKRKTVQNEYRISSEKVGSCFIDWMWF